MAGYGPRTQWYRNILAEPRVDLRLPGQAPFAALAEEVRDPGVRARVIPPLCRSMAVPGLMIGCLPATSTDERILDCVSWVPLVRIRPADGGALVPGAEDPGGRGWVWRHLAMTGATSGVSACSGGSFAAEIRHRLASPRPRPRNREGFRAFQATYR